MRGRGGEGKEGNRKREGRETRGGCLLLNLNLATLLLSCNNVCQFIVIDAGLCQSCSYNPKAFTVSHLVTLKETWPQASHQLNPALSCTHQVLVLVSSWTISSVCTFTFTQVLLQKKDLVESLMEASSTAGPAAEQTTDMEQPPKKMARTSLFVSYDRRCQHSSQGFAAAVC